jgi:hypothetical protein
VQGWPELGMTCLAVTYPLTKVSAKAHPFSREDYVATGVDETNTDGKMSPNPKYEHCLNITACRRVNEECLFRVAWPWLARKRLGPYFTWGPGRCSPLCLSHVFKHKRSRRVFHTCQGTLRCRTGPPSEPRSLSHSARARGRPYPLRVQAKVRFSPPSSRSCSHFLVRSPYDILDLETSAKADDIKKKYRQLSLCEPPFSTRDVGLCC